MSYGISNKNGQTSKLEAKKILDMASASGIDTLDTAAVYGYSEVTLGELGVGRWKVISKIPPLTNDVISGSEWVLRYVKASLFNLKTDQLDGVLLHAPEQLLSPFGSQIINGLKKAKSLGIVKKIGYSIYSTECLPSFLGVMKPDIVQLPINIFDQRAINTGWIKKMIALGIEVHARSVFMQGLLLMDPAKRPSYFRKWRLLFKKWDSMLARVSAVEACFGFIKSVHGISRVIVGVESQEQLKQLLLAWENAVSTNAPELSCEDEALVNPSNWSI